VIEFGVRDTLTDATGTRVTVIAEEPALPSLLAVMVARPIDRAVTSPFASTDAVAGLVDDQLTSRPESVLPSASLVVAASCCVEPSVTLTLGGLTTTAATGTGVTVSWALPVFVSLVAVMLAEPAASDVTSPVGETVAMLVFPDAQVTVRPVRGLPAASSVAAVACVVCPATTEADAKETSTDPTGIGVTVTVAVATFVSLTTAILATPGEIADTNPVAETVAIFGSSELHPSDRPVRRLWRVSSSVATSCCVPLWTTLAAVGLTAMLATGA
jgi:hypothetical protein